MLDAEDLCQSPMYYINAARLMFRGPLTDIQLDLPTNFVVRLDLEGWGFSDTDSIRLISMTQTCRENANDPRGSMSTVWDVLGRTALAVADPM